MSAHGRRVLLALLLGGCQQASSAAGRPPGDEPGCTELPAELPSAAVIHYSRDDGEHQSIHDIAYVVDAACPESDPITLAAPACARVSRDVMQAMWTRLRVLEVHHVVMVDREGRCPHCAGPWIRVAWPDGRCSVGEGHAWAISDDSAERFHAAARYLDGISQVVKEKASPQPEPGTP